VLTLNDRIQQQIAALPGVRGVSYSNTPMVSGSLSETGFQLVPGANAPEVNSDWMPVGLHFFSTMGMKLLQGRDFEARDFTPMVEGHPPANAPAKPPTPVIVNREFVQRYLKDGRVLGREFGYGKSGTRPQYVIVGVVSNTKYQSLRADIDPTTYAPLNSPFTSFEIRTAGDPMAMLPAVAQAVHSVEANLPLMRPSSQMQTIDRMLARERMVAKLAAIFGGLALLLAAIGLYGLLAQEVTRRTREIGIRMALGAARAQVLRLVLGLGSLLTVLGLALGLLGAWGATRYLGTMLYGVQASDPITLTIVGVILVLVALAACFLPARRATRVDPMVALRYE
jgi:predicted permease